MSARSAGADLRLAFGARPFRALFLAHLVSNLGDWLAFLALFGLAALAWHASATRIAFLAVAYVVPLAVVAPLAGVGVDRWDLRRILVASDLARALLVLGMAFTSNYGVLLGLLFLHQACGCFFNPAQGAALPRLVDRERILAANALTTSAAHLAKIAGPAVAGLLVAKFGPRGCLVADAASFLLSAVALATLPPLPAAPRSSDAERRALWHELQSGWSFLRQAHGVRHAVGLVTVTMAVLGGFLALLAVYARDSLGAGSRGMGFLLSSLGCGAIAGAFAVTHTGSRWPKLRSVAGGMLLMAAALLLLARGGSQPVAFAAVFLLGLAAAAVLVPAQALLQEETPQGLLGRVSSSAVAIIGLAQGASMALAGPLSAWVGMPRWLAGGAVALTVAVVLWWVAGQRTPRVATRV